jgi:hypothetical protein
LADPARVLLETLAMAGRQVGPGTVVGELTGDGVAQLLAP